MTITQFQKTFAEGSAPTRATIISRIQKGVYVGVFEGIWYIFPDKKPALNQKFAQVFDDFDKEALSYADGQTS